MHAPRAAHVHSYRLVDRARAQSISAIARSGVRNLLLFAGCSTFGGDARLRDSMASNLVVLRAEQACMDEEELEALFGDIGMSDEEMTAFVTDLAEGASHFRQCFVDSGGHSQM